MSKGTQAIKGKLFQKSKAPSFSIYFSTQPKAMNPRKRVKNKDQIVDDDEEDGKSVKASRDPDKIDPWGDNPDWDSHWVKAHKINYLGRVSRD